jgi:hypothetical protein
VFRPSGLAFCLSMEPNHGFTPATLRPEPGKVPCYRFPGKMSHVSLISLIPDSTHAVMPVSNFCSEIRGGMRCQGYPLKQNIRYRERLVVAGNLVAMLRLDAY